MTQETIGIQELWRMLEQGEPVTLLDIGPADQREEWSIPASDYLGANRGVVS